MEVLVIGGGVVGLCCARELLRQGAEVTLIERGRCGEATSFRNAGQIVPSLAAPLAAPGIVKHALGGLFQADSPFRLRPRPALAYAGWLWRFARSASDATYQRCMQAAAAFGSDTPALYEQMQADGVAFEFHRDGLLFAALNDATVAADAALYRRLEAIGYPRAYRALDAAAIRDFEPALSEAVAGGVFVEGEAHVRPESLVRGLRADIAARGARLLEDTPVDGLCARAHGWRALCGECGYDAERVLVTAGVGTRQLLAPLGVNVPIEAGKGYSVTATGAGVAPRRPLKFTEPELVVTPYDGAVRVSGLFDLGARHTRVERRRLATVTRTVRPYLRDWQADGAAVEWAGLRPATPDTLPIIDAVAARPNLYIAAGHGILGVTHAPATARAAAPLVLQNRRAPEIERLRLDRFGPARARR